MGPTKTWALVAAGVLAVPLFAIQQGPGTTSCCEPTEGNSPVPGGNLGNQNYSALTMVNLDNIRDLGPAWRVNVSAVPPATDHTGSQATPIAVDGVIYMPTPSGGVIAVDGATGETRWKWQPSWADGGGPRGFSIGDGKLYTTGEDDRLIALDPATGEEVWVVQHPVAPNGIPLESVGETALLYHDGMIYGGARGGPAAAFALDTDDGSVAWAFYGPADIDTVVTDVNGEVIDAGATWGPPLEDGRSCAMDDAGVTPWRHGAIDPEAGMAYYTFGNARSCESSQDGSRRPGQNLFSSSLVAMDLKTGEYRWHFQSIHHDIWDMDNVHPPLLADVPIDGEVRPAIYYGSKSGHLFVLDRTTGKPLLPVEERPRPLDSRQGEWPTQPFPDSRPFPECAVFQALDPDNVPGDPFRAVPNYNGYQVNEAGQLVYTEPNYLTPDAPFMTYPPEYGTHRRGCLYDTHWDLPVLSTSSQNGGGDWSLYSYSHDLGLVYFPYGVNLVAHWRGAGGNGQRARGQYQTGGIVAIDASTNRVAWTNHLGLDMAHGQSPLTTAGDLLFAGQFDGNFLALNASSGEEVWRFQTGAGISSAPITYTANGEQYVAIFAGGTGNPYGGQVTRGDALWAFKLGGAYETASGSGEAPAPPPLAIRRPVDDATWDRVPPNTVYLAYQPAGAAGGGRGGRGGGRGGASQTPAGPVRDSTATASMLPSVLRVPVGTTVTFTNPGDAQIGGPGSGNQNAHCATQFFEGLFNPRLEPGESFQYTFDRAGEYFFNDCTDPRPTGKVEVYLMEQDVPGAVSFAPGALDLSSPTGVFTGVQGVVTARFAIPDGHSLDGSVAIRTPLSDALFPAVSATVTPDGRTLVAEFRKADIDNNVPEGDSVPLAIVADFVHNGVQKRLVSTVSVTVIK